MYAQQINPSTWNDFVSSKQNVIVLDTFMIQDFTDLPYNNWQYELIGETALFDPQTAGIMDGSGTPCLKMLPGSNIHMHDFTWNSYKEVHLIAVYAAKDLMKGEDLYLSTERSIDTLVNFRWLAAPDHYSVSFRAAKMTTPTKYHLLKLISDPRSLKLEVGMATAASAGGFYALDSLYVYGEVGRYSLFTGEGDWREAGRWSNDPAFRNRHALIDGKANINDYTTCGRIYLGNGSVHVAENKSLIAKELLFCTAESAFSSAGEVVVRDRITVYRTFPEKGKWYFISFPFDVYLEDMDATFALKDDSPNEGGNFFYLCNYDGEARSRGETTDSHYWQVMSAASVSAGEPLLQKNKGYLISLDEKATTNVVSFSSAKGDIPLHFGRTGEISITTAPRAYQVGKSEHGWYLCGNPLPSPLPLASLVPYFAEESSVYLFENGNYMAYPMDSDYAIPPFSAFFVKAEADRDIPVTAPSTTLYRIISTPEALSMTKAGPTLSSPVSTVSSPLAQTQASFVELNTLFLENLLMPGVVYLVDLGGRTHWQRQIKSGSSVLNLPSSLPKGFYIVCINTSRYQAQHKFILNH
ncbi:T9SS type A sorting domain-containing protein [Parabacteroides sp. OttesenSCG-928-G06]|nr:T9SS type A sorting domain-containing protein [Parabacteroides sp. OttesenSCG-928-G06]